MKLNRGIMTVCWIPNLLYLLAIVGDLWHDYHINLTKWTIFFQYQVKVLQQKVKAAEYEQKKLEEENEELEVDKEWKVRGVKVKGQVCFK